MFLSRKKNYILWFSELTNKDVPLVGGKNASLGEMYQKLTKKGVRIPNGFAITVSAYQYFLAANQLALRIKTELADLNTKDLHNLQAKGKHVRQMIQDSTIPDELKKSITDAYHKLSQNYGQENTDVAVRSSATAEDLPDASFAGQQATFLNVKGETELMESVKSCFASLFTDRAISYRQDKKFDHSSIYLSVGIQKMVRSDKACSGVMFTLDPDTGFRNVVVINASWGLGELVVQGEVIPDEYEVFKPTLVQNFPSIITKNLGTKLEQMVYGVDGQETKTGPTPPARQIQFCLTDQEILQLARWALIIENHYQKPMDTEWAKDGISGQLYIVQARPETVQAVKKVNVIEDYQLKEKTKVLTKGSSVGTKIGAGQANIITSAKDINKFKQGEVLITRITDPDWEPIMKIASAIVTNEGGRTSHAAIVSRELGIPCIVGTQDATKAVKQGQMVTVDCSSGAQGFVYEGECRWEVKQYNLSHLKKPKTKIMINVGSPNEAFKASFLPNSGVGLAREEFIIASQIKIHPLALINFDRLKDEKIKREIEKLTQGYRSKTEFYVQKLAEGIAKITAAFYPNPVIVRFSDFKTNEYATLLGGTTFEPKEENPMLGWRGASRYYDPEFEAAFGLECRAIKIVRETWGLKNLVVMIPFCRTVAEGHKVLSTMSKHGLQRGAHGLKVYMMCEIPANIILAEKFLRLFDGFSIGSNDLTQLTLGIDRDNSGLSSIANENDPAVEDLITHVVKIARKQHKYIGICGQAPSDYPAYAKFLVGLGIESISLNPDTVLKTTLSILSEEQHLQP